MFRTYIINNHPWQISKNNKLAEKIKYNRLYTNWRYCWTLKFINLQNSLVTLELLINKLNNNDNIENIIYPVSAGSLHTKQIVSDINNLLVAHADLTECVNNQQALAKFNNNCNLLPNEIWYIIRNLIKKISKWNLKNIYTSFTSEQLYLISIIYLIFILKTNFFYFILFYMYYK